MLVPGGRGGVLIERLVDMLARRLDVDPAELRMRNLIEPEQFPYTSPTGWEYDSGDYPRALRLALDLADYDGLRRSRRPAASGASTWASG